MTTPTIRRGRVEAGLVGLAGGDGVLHGVVDFEDGSLGAVFAVFCLVLALYDGEGVHDVVHGFARRGEGRKQRGKFCGGFVFVFFPCAIGIGRQIEMEDGGIQLATQLEAAILVPAERRTVKTAVLGKGF